MGIGAGNGSINGKLGKIKCMIRKLQTKSHQNQTSTMQNSDKLTTTVMEKVEDDAQTVYVGKTRRRYLVNSDVIHHPLFQVLVKKSGVFTGGGLAVGCEVVLFEHLLWLLQNTDPSSESLDELVDFYAY
ncbi:SAUR-like auxin-responsive protein family [Zostera marina]|uniref:SAUR-like auxin-responsive protein family n=1 Tax=Zostera marina TaxID=29655 RepID=A0A0K9P1I1_ZOSMR|nr:SAUR-like auxin-responsive protein family [Zostera marina]